MKRNRCYKVMSLLIVLSLLLCACAPADPRETKPYSQEGPVLAAERNQYRSFSGVEFVTAEHGEDYVIQWQDPALEQLIRQALGKPEGDVRHSDVWDIWRLSLYRDKETVKCSLSRTPPEGELTYENSLYQPAEQMGGELEAGEGEWKLTLGDLRHFDALQVLKLQNGSGSAVHSVTVDLSGLEALTGLQVLSIADVSLEHQQSLSGCTGLQVLAIHGALDSLEPLGTMQKLRHLTVEQTVNTLDLEPLTKLPELAYLSLDVVAITTMEPFARMGALRYLSLHRTPRESLDSLEYLADTDITHLDLGIPGMEEEQYRDLDLSPLAKLEQLVYLDLTSHPAATIELLNGIIAQAPGLAYLEIGYTDTARQYNRDNSVLDTAGLTYLGADNPI